MKKKMLKTIKFFILLVIVPLFIFSCVVFMRTSPEAKNFNERLISFPTENLPLKAEANIYWDKHLIPFIDARTDEDAAFLLGMVHTHLRFSQMNLFRRIVEGRLAESAGPLAASIDHALRILDFGQAAEEIEKNLPVETRKWLTEYVRGINYYQDQLSERPTDYKVLGLEKEPWTITDIITIGRLVGADVSWFNYFSFLKLRNRNYWPDFWNRLLDLGFNSSTSFTAESSQFSAILNSAAKSGSNAFVVAGSRSEDGNALIASDPHLGIQLPNTWIIAGFKSPSYHVVGMMFPGIPMVLIGRNPAISWGGTNMRSASSDVYNIAGVDDISFDTREEQINVRWWFDDEVSLRNTRYGPIISDMPVLDGVKEDEVLALKWIGHEVSDEFSTFLKVNRAVDWNTFRDAFKSYAVSGQNFLYADTSGNIGQVLAVRSPVRSLTRPPGLVLNPELAWNGYRNPDELPDVYNPASGFIVSSNNRPVVTDPPVGYFYSSNDRVDRLTYLLDEKTKYSLEDLKTIQQDVVVPSAVILRDIIFERIELLGLNAPDDADRTIFLKELREWDGSYKKELTAPVNYQLLLHHFIEQYYPVKYDENIAGFMRSSDNSNVLIAQDIKSDNSELLNNALAKALESAVYGKNKYESWGDMHRLQLNHILGNIPVLGNRFQYCDLPADGSVNTVMKTAHQITDERHRTFYGANSRFAARMSEMDENYFVLLGGQDGWLGSDYFLDHVPAWRSGEYIQVPLRIQVVRQQFDTHMNLSIK